MMWFNRKYKERIAELEQELKESKQELYSTKKAIRDFIVNKENTLEIISIVTAFQFNEDMEAMIWAGYKTRDNDNIHT